MNFLQEELLNLKKILDKKLANNPRLDRTKKIPALFNKIFDYYHSIEHETNRGLESLENLAELNYMQLEGVVSDKALVNTEHFWEHLGISRYENNYPIKIKKSMDSSLPEDMWFDVVNVTKALNIVLKNACRFSHTNGKVILSLEKFPQDEKKYFVLSIQDFGVGMHENQIKKLAENILDSYNQRELLYAKPSIQLARAKMYLEASGGQLEITSVLNKGTTVRLIIAYQLPKNKVTTNEKLNAATKKQKSYKNSGFICPVLLVEDDLMTQKMTRQILVKLGYKIDTAKNGAEAISMSRANDYPIVLLDMTLPDMSGLDTIREIRTFKKTEDETIFIALSAHSSEKDMDYFTQKGIATLLAKPVKPKLLEEAIALALKIQREPHCDEYS
jgi:CheY-like chemotaxis protein